MTQFSSKERFIARVLSSTPRLKALIKNLYVRANYIINQKKYKYCFFDNRISTIEIIEPVEAADSTFYGYYDKSPENNSGFVIFNETSHQTERVPSSKDQLKVYVINLHTKDILTVCSSYSYNWQQGCRAQWLSNDCFIFNDFIDNGYKSCIYDLGRNKILKTFDRAVQDAYCFEYFLSINYERIMRLRPDYGYCNLPPLSENDLMNLNNDGIWRIDISTSEETMIVSLSDLVELSPKSSFRGSLHKVNHVMISPDGKKFIFIHRWYSKGKRHDRLVLSNFSNIKILSDEDMVSHMCWIDNDTIFGYLRHKSKDGFYFVNVNTIEYQECELLTALGNGDGHPSCHGDWIVFDTYPDKSRMQHLYLYNITTGTVYKLLEVFHGIKYQGVSRCDLHPRFSPDGKRVYFDTVYKGIRRLAYIDISLFE